MNMVEEASNAWLWCSRINTSIEHEQVKKSGIHADKRDLVLEGRPTTSSIKDPHIWWSENDQQIWSHAVASDLSMGADGTYIPFCDSRLCNGPRVGWNGCTRRRRNDSIASNEEGREKRLKDRNADSLLANRCHVRRHVRGTMAESR